MNETHDRVGRRAEPAVTPEPGVTLSLEGKVALVTGASRGIGFAIARRLAEAGAAVMLCSRTSDDLERAAGALSSDGAAVGWHAANVGDPQQARECVDDTVERFGRLDVLVNNAGMNIHSGPLVEIDDARADKILKVNQHAVVVWTAAAWNASMRERGGAVVNVSAIGGLAVYPGSGWYNATKAAVIQMTRQLAYELGPGVRVNGIAPGVVQTDLARRRVDEDGEGLAARLPLRRLGLPDDIAMAALFLASDAASWITGHTVVVDGGALLTPPGGL